MSGVSGLAEVMNQSLTPTRVGQPFSPSNYPDKKSVVAAYKRMVLMLLDLPEERAKLQKALKDFRSSLLVEDLMEQLGEILQEPRKRQLYLAIRSLVPSRLRAEYNSHIPHIPTFDKKIVHLKQQGSRSLGFSIRGGKEFGCGVYISQVAPSSKAAQSGLKIGDEILRVNGLILSDSTHGEVTNLIRLKKTLTLTVRAVGMIPEQDCFGKITWKTVEERKARSHHINPMLRLNTAILKCTKKIQVMVDESEVLGASIKTSSNPQHGVLITELLPNSVAHNAGLKIGDELVDVNGHSLINKQHREAIALLKSSNSLMLTVRVKDPKAVKQNFDPLNNPPEDFELSPNDFDIDAELIPTDLNQSHGGFVLKSRDHGQSEHDDVEHRNRNQRYAIEDANKRLSLLDMEARPFTHAPMIASPAAVGYGPTFANPTILGMMPEMPKFEESTDGGEEGNDSSLLSTSGMGLSPEHNPANVRESTTFPDNLTNFGSNHGNVPASIANIFPDHHGTVGTQEGGGQIPKETAQTLVNGAQVEGPPSPGPPPAATRPKKTPPVALKPKKSPPAPPKQTQIQPSQQQGEESRKISLQATFQFPPEEDEVEQEEDSDEAPHTPTKHQPNYNKLPSSSALKKSPGDGSRKRSPAFKESVEIINVQGNLESGSSDTLQGETVHPSNMEFSDKVLQERKVAFHTVPKVGPIKIAIRGGTDTPLGGSIYISRILEGGAADRYGKLNVGDQILVCDGVSLIEVTHDEAAQALKRAMDMESNSVDLVVAVNPDVEEKDDTGTTSPRTMWPPPEQNDTVCDDHPASSKHFDFAKSSRRAHSGFTLRGNKDADGSHSAHTFLPNVPK